MSVSEIEKGDEPPRSKAAVDNLRGALLRCRLYLQEVADELRVGERRNLDDRLPLRYRGTTWPFPPLFCPSRVVQIMVLSDTGDICQNTLLANVASNCRRTAVAKTKSHHWYIMNRTITLNVPNELSGAEAVKVLAVYRQMAGWIENKDLPYWFGTEEDDQFIVGSLEPSGLLLEGNVDERVWIGWITVLCAKLTLVLGREIHDAES